jgi:hypothetical protein
MGETTEYPAVEMLLRIGVTAADWYDQINRRELHEQIQALLRERSTLEDELERTRQQRDSAIAVCKEAQEIARENAADRDAWQAKAEDAERRLDDEKALRFEAQRPAARRLRVVQFHGYDDWYRWNDGTLEALVGSPPRWKVQTHIRTEWIEAVAALRDDPFEPVETLEGVVCSAVREWNDTAHKTGADCSELVANAVRAWLAQQPAPGREHDTPLTDAPERIIKALATLAKAWPVLAKHADHMDGAFLLALNEVRSCLTRLYAQQPATTRGEG